MKKKRGKLGITFLSILDNKILFVLNEPSQRYATRPSSHFEISKLNPAVSPPPQFLLKARLDFP